MKRPTAFEKIHQGELLGRVTLPDRVLFRGHLKLRDARTLGVFLAYSHVLLKDFGAYAEANTAERSRVRYSSRFGAKRYTLDLLGVYRPLEFPRKMAEMDGSRTRSRLRKI